jgi:hypothetical protein
MLDITNIFPKEKHVVMLNENNIYIILGVKKNILHVQKEVMSIFKLFGFVKNPDFMDYPDYWVQYGFSMTHFYIHLN